MKILETERLQLSFLSEIDADFIVNLLNTPGFLQNIGDRQVRTREDAVWYLTDGPLKSYAQNGFGLFRVGLRETNEPIGMCGLIRRDTLEYVDVGYAFLPEHTGKGYATEVVKATLAYGRQVHGLDRIVAIVSPGNAASVRVLEKAGMADNGTIQVGAEILLYFSTK